MITIMSLTSSNCGDIPHDIPIPASLADHVRSALRLWRPAGSVLFRDGERPTWMFYVHHGEVLMQRVTPSGTLVVLKRISEGFLAEGSLTNAAYFGEAVCRTDCILFALPMADIRAAVAADEESCWAWMELLGAQLRQQRMRVERLTLKTVRDRLAHLLVSESQPDGSYRLCGTRMDLAAELGVTPAALYRELAALQAERLLVIDESRWFWRG
jgi:CRP-like cAMP-binding protein